MIGWVGGGTSGALDCRIAVVGRAEGVTASSVKLNRQAEGMGKVIHTRSFGNSWIGAYDDMGEDGVRQENSDNCGCTSLLHITRLAPGSRAESGCTMATGELVQLTTSWRQASI